MDGKANIIMFVADQMRSDALHHLGNEASITPAFDAILKEGVSFENAYCQNPVCVPSRCSFLSGLYPHTTGHRTMHYLQKEDEENLLKMMKQNGYEVIWIGRNDVLSKDVDKSLYCDYYFDGKMDVLQKDYTSMSKHKLYSFYVGECEQHAYIEHDWNCIEQLLSYLDKKAMESNGKPFFIYCSLLFPHPPYMCEKQWYGRIDKHKLPQRRPNVSLCDQKASMLNQVYEKQEIYQMNDEEMDEIRTTYLAMVSRVDHQFQLIREKLLSLSLYDDTNILVFSDHGDYTTDYGIVEKVQNCFEDPISKVPLLIKPVKGIPLKPRISSALVELLDIPATICEMAGIPLPYQQFGKSLLPLLKDEVAHKDAVFCEGGRLHGEQQAMEKGHGPQSPYWPRLSTQASEGPEHTKACMIRMGNYKYVMRLYEEDEFYDLENDVLECKNRIYEEKYKEQIVSMKLRMLRFFMETSDFVPMKKDKR